MEICAPMKRPSCFSFFPSPFPCFLFFLFAAALLLPGCASPEDTEPAGAVLEAELAKKPEALVSIHSVVRYPEDCKNAGEVPAFAGPPVLIDLTAWLTSAGIESAEAAERPDRPGVFDILLALSPEGRKQWEKMLAAKAPDGFAFVVDGVFYRMIHPRRFYNPEVRVITVDGPFDRVIARDVAGNARLNFLKLRRKRVKTPGAPPAATPSAP